MFKITAKKMICYCATVIFLSVSGCSNAETIRRDEKPIIISIDAKGKIYLQEQQIALEEVVPKLKAIPNRKPDAQVFLRGDKSISYDRLMQVMGNINAAGFKRVALVANMPKPETTDPSAMSQGIKSSAQRMTIIEEDALRRQVEACWNMPVGGRDAQTLVVETIIDVNPDRTVKNVEIVDKKRYSSDPFFRVVADSATRALRHPKCSPLDLPEGKYDQWKRIEFTFDPHDMM